jgi:glycerol-3-phosphate acyltransferase PlsX
VNKPVIIGHGISNAKAFSNMIALAEKMIETKFCEIITTNFENL